MNLYLSRNQIEKISVKYQLLPFFLLIVGNICLGQNYGDANKRIFPQPPNVASLLKFNETPVNYFNGTADVSIPLYGLNEGDIHLPISLSYFTGGIKVNEEASWVGLGWNLNVGGVIQEIIIGEPDYEQHGFNMANYNFAPKPNSPPGTPWTDSSDTYNISEDGFGYLDSTGQLKSYRNLLDLSQQNELPNFEYDLYSYNFNGYSGKFILSGGVNGQSLGKENIVFKLNAPQSFIGFDTTSSMTAMTPDGTQYIFAIIGVTSTLRQCNTSTRYILPIMARTWYLSKIIYPNNQEINFSYIQTTSRTLPTVDENWVYTNHYGPGPIISGGGEYHAIQNYSTVENYYLSQINFDNGQINFYTSSRQDIENGLKLDSVRINSNFSENAGVIKTIGFNYGYFTGASYMGDWTNMPLFQNSQTCPGQYYLPDANFSDYKSKRLQLSQVTFSNNQRGALPYSYSLVYGGPPLPLKTSLGQDLWGFSNGSNNSSLLPNYNNIGYWDKNVPYSLLAGINFSSQGFTLGNRAANSNSQAGTLKEIIYPTGGHSVFTYENNIANNTYYGIQTNIVNANAIASDYSTGIQQTVFTIPDVGIQGSYYDQDLDMTLVGSVNPVEIDVTLWCCQGSISCSSQGNACTAYGVTSNRPDLGLYTYLEKYNTSTSQWEILANYKFDISTSYFSTGSNPTGIVSLQTGLPPGQYRIIANYPDNAPNMPTTPDGAKAEMIVRYKKIQQTVASQSLITVGGIRVKSIDDYNTDGSVLHRYFSYSKGKLMSFPLFYRDYEQNNDAQMYSVDVPDNHVYVNTVGNGYEDCNYMGALGYVPAPVIPSSEYSLYSNPVMPYSYSAQGSVVGYDTVTVTRDTIGGDGKTRYVYNCIPDEYNTYDAFIMPGIPTTPYLENGSLKKQFEYRMSGSNYILERVTNYYYNYTTHTKWCFKAEYHPPYVYGSAGGYEDCSYHISEAFAPGNLYLNFYPIKFGKLKTIQRVDSSFDNPSKPIVTTTNYTYNSLNQVATTTSISSNGKTKIVADYYPSDYISTDISQEMRNRNMIDYPIETISSVNGLSINGIYNQYYLHDNIVTPQQSFLLRKAAPITTIPSAPNNTIDAHYQIETNYKYNANGNILEQQKTNNVKEAYLWGYNGQYPVAKIVGSDYNTVNGIVPQASIDAATGSDAQMRSTLNLLRTQLPNAQVWTYTYAPLMGMTSETDPKGNTIFYEYDGFGRLKDAKDKDGNVIKKYDYHYQGQ